MDVIGIYGNISNSLPNTLEFSAPSTGEAESRAFGVVAQDVLTFNKWVQTFLGIRYSSTETVSGGETTESEAVNPLMGIIVSPFENINVFGSYTNSSYPRTASRLDVNG